VKSVCFISIYKEDVFSVHIYVTNFQFE